MDRQWKGAPEGASMAIETQSDAQREKAFQNTLGQRLHATAKIGFVDFCKHQKTHNLLALFRNKTHSGAEKPHGRQPRP